MSSSSSHPAIPEKFRITISDFACDLTHTFPEFAEKLSQLTNPEALDATTVFQHCLTVYPERFFDILNQNAEIFAASSTVNVQFLPNVDFKVLFGCTGITEKTRESIWKYLQVILFMLVGSISDKSDFGPSMNLFEGVGEDELQDKLKDVMENLGKFFGASSTEEEVETGSQETSDFEKAFTAFFREEEALQMKTAEIRRRPKTWTPLRTTRTIHSRKAARNRRCPIFPNRRIFTSI